MITRRQVLKSFMASAALIPVLAVAGKNNAEGSDWSSFRSNMMLLADDADSGSASQDELVETGVRHLQQLDIDSASFKKALDESFETGNRFWLWQRMIKQSNLNGGVLTIEDTEMVKLHDHPGATGIVRIISGQAEVWQYDELPTKSVPQAADDTDTVMLRRVTHRILSPGDTAVLTPDNGNIHALRSVTRQCQMLDFFIPPYHRRERSWYRPLTEQWFDKETFLCSKLSQDDFDDV